MPYADPEKARISATLRQRAYSKRHPERVRERSLRQRERISAFAKEHGLKFRDAAKAIAKQRTGTTNAHGLLAAEYHAMRRAQNEACALCGVAGPLCVDHEHVTGWDRMPPIERAKHVRGLLCAACNTFIGRCKERPLEILMRVQNMAVRIERYLVRQT